MYLRLIILALLFLFSERSNAITFHFSPMEISDALPVQFWLVGCATYNEHIADGVHHKCFCAPWQCDDEIKVQFKDDPSQNFSLLVLDEDEQIIDIVAIDEPQVGVYAISYIPSEASTASTELPPLSEWLTGSVGDVPWTLGAAPSVALTGSETSEYLYVDYPFIPGNEYTIGATYNLNVSALTFIFTIRITDSSFNTQFSIITFPGAAGSNNSNLLTFVATSSCTRIALVAFTDTGSVTVTINSTTTQSEPIDICNKKIQFKIRREAGVQGFSLPALNTWANGGGAGDPWTTGSNPSFTVSPGGPNSEYLFVDYAFIVGVEYSVHINYTSSSSTLGCQTGFIICNSSFAIQFSGGVDVIGLGAQSTNTITFTATASTTRIAIRITFDGFSGTTVTLNSTTATRSFGSQELVAKSDCLYIADEQEDTILLTYSNHRNFAGLVYAAVSPENEFYIRIPAIFFHQRFPEEDETMELSTSLVTLNGTVRKQRLIDTDYVPYYFHEKLKLILKHQILTIFNRQWVKQEAYEILDGDRRWPVKKAKCWISEKDFVHRNIL